MSTCPACDGACVVWHDDMLEPCAECDGTGKVSPMASDALETMPLARAMAVYGVDRVIADVLAEVFSQGSDGSGRAQEASAVASEEDEATMVDSVTIDDEGVVLVVLREGDEPREMSPGGARELAVALLVAADIGEEGIAMDPIGDGPVPRDMAVRILREICHMSIWPADFAEGLRELREGLERD